MTRAFSSPHLFDHRRAALDATCEKYALHGLRRKLLEAVLVGYRGPELASALALEENVLDVVVRGFQRDVGVSVYEAAVDVLAAAARLHRESSRPPPLVPARRRAR